MFKPLRSTPLAWLASLVLAMLALSSAGQALYLSGKAWLAQQLLYAAWQEGEDSNTEIKPWPWADIHPRGLLEVPGLGVQQVVLNDHSGESLAFGPGVAESNGSAVLAGHRDSHFTFVENLQVGDHINWRPSGRPAQGFRVSSVQVLDTRLQEEIVPPEDALLLITCFPFDTLEAGGPLRYVVVARKVYTL